MGLSRLWSVLFSLAVLMQRDPLCATCRSRLIMWWLR